MNTNEYTLIEDNNDNTFGETSISLELLTPPPAPRGKKSPCMILTPPAPREKPLKRTTHSILSLSPKSGIIPPPSPKKVTLQIPSQTLNKPKIKLPTTPLPRKYIYSDDEDESPLVLFRESSPEPSPEPSPESFLKRILRTCFQLTHDNTPIIYDRTMYT